MTKIEISNHFEKKEVRIWLNSPSDIDNYTRNEKMKIELQNFVIKHWFEYDLVTSYGTDITNALVICDDEIHFNLFKFEYKD